MDRPGDNQGGNQSGSPGDSARVDPGGSGSSGSYPPPQGGYSPPPSGGYSPPPPQGGYSPPPPGGYSPGGQYQPPPGYGGGYPPQYGGQMRPPPGPMPDNQMLLSILAIFCCWPFAIPAFINGSQVSTKWAQGDYAGAQEASRQARKWAMIGIWLGVAWAVIVAIFWVVALVTGAAFFSVTGFDTFATAVATGFVTP